MLKHLLLFQYKQSKEVFKCLLVQMAQHLMKLILNFKPKIITWLLMNMIPTFNIIVVIKYWLKELVIILKISNLKFNISLKILSSIYLYLKIMNLSYKINNNSILC